MQQAFFDTYAPAYDAHFTRSLIGRAQRKQVYRHALNNSYYFQKNVLEVNCGTGEDALWLAKQGARVLATDISLGMLDIAKAKVTGQEIEFRQLAAQSIGQLAPGKFGTIFSNFGGLNCLSPREMEYFASSCSGLQGYEDQLVMVLMGRKCLWERFYFRKDPAKARRRLGKEGVEAVIEGKKSMVYYYSPGEIKEIFKKNYSHENTKPIGFFVPPSYLEEAFQKRKSLFYLLRFLDRIFSFSFLANYADHYIIFFEKRS